MHAVCAVQLNVLKEAQDLSINPAVLVTLKALLDRAAPLLVDSGFVSLLIEKIASEVDFTMNDDSESDDDESEEDSAAKRISRRRDSVSHVAYYCWHLFILMLCNDL